MAGMFLARPDRAPVTFFCPKFGRTLGLAGDSAQSIAHRLPKLRARIDVVVPGAVDGAVEYEVRNSPSESRGPLCRHDLVAAGSDDRDRHLRLLDGSRGVDLVGQKRADRQPREHRLRKGSERIEWR